MVKRCRFLFGHILLYSVRVQNASSFTPGPVPTPPFKFSHLKWRHPNQVLMFTVDQYMFGMIQLVIMQIYSNDLSAQEYFAVELLSGYINTPNSLKNESNYLRYNYAHSACALFLNSLL